MIGGFIRKKAFWTLDFFNHNEIKKNIKKINIIRATENNKEELEAILDYVTANVPYYSNISSNDIQNFPVVNKLVYRQKFDLFRSNEFKSENDLKKVYTSGSTGTPFMAFQDHGKIKMHQAALISMNHNIGWELGDKYLFLRVWGLGYSKKSLKIFIENMTPISVINFDENAMENMRRKLLRKKRLRIILGYSSALSKFVKYIKENGFENENYGVKLIIADSDNLSEDTWCSLENVFKCPVLNRYGTNENGIIALTKPYDHKFYFDLSQFYVEILKLDSDESVVEGEIGRIVITDLHNKAFPFIRYDIGDLGVADKIVNGQCIRISSLEGRMSTTLFTADGELLSETSVVAHFKTITGIERFQIIQTGTAKYKILLENTDIKLDSEIQLCALKCFGKTATIEIDHVSTIPVGANGKFKATINEIR